MAALIQPYTDAWAQSFALIAETLREVIGAADLQVHHIGSTAVPGLPAKPIIDIDVVLPEKMDLATMAARLASIGYTHHGDQGIPAREVFKRQHRKADHPLLDAVPHHLYVCPATSPELDRHLRFRNALRQHRWAREEYATLKLRLAAEAGQDRKKYAALKEVRAREVVLRILAVQDKEE